MADSTEHADFPELAPLRGTAVADPELVARVQLAALRAFKEAHARRTREAGRVPWFFLALAPFTIAQLCLAFLGAMRIFSAS